MFNLDDIARWSFLNDEDGTKMNGLPEDLQVDLEDAQVELWSIEEGQDNEGWPRPVLGKYTGEGQTYVVIRVVI